MTEIKKILITGNMGYIGPSVVERLRYSYPEAVLAGIDIGYFAHCLTNVDIFPENDIDIQYFSDIRHFSNEVLADVDAIVHLSAISNDPMGNTFEKVTTAINYRASIDLANKAKKAGVKVFVFASSCSMYGYHEDSPRTEGSSLNPLTPYAKSKCFTENDLKKLADKTFKVTSLRFSTACGISKRLRLDLVLNDFVASAVASGKITILSDGKPWRPLINIQDMALAIDWAISRDIDCGGHFLAINVGSDVWNFQIRELAEAVSKVIPKIEISISKDAQPDKRSYKVNFDLFKKLAPEYQPQVDLKTTIEELKYGLEAMNFKDKSFRDSELIRLNVLSNYLKNGMLTENLEWIR